jgi:xanthine dehydrogenase YagS FAD-binding subunit
MRPFEFVQVEDTPSAFAAASVSTARFVAGGTNILDLMKLGVERPERLIDINALPLRSVEIRADGSAQIGALVRNSDLACHPALRRLYPVLSEALLSGASPQLRNMATVGGT